MIAPATLRTWHIEQLQKSIQTVKNLVTLIPAQDLTAYRDGGNGWTVSEVLCHLRDFDVIYPERITLALEQEDGQMVFYDADELAVQNRYAEQDWQKTLADWDEMRAKNIAFLKGLDESAWRRSAIHPKRGAMTVQDQVALWAWHDLNHIEQITKILVEKK